MLLHVYACGLDQEAQLLVIQWYIVWLVAPPFAQPLSYNYEKTNGPTAMNLSQDFGSCLKLLIFTLNH